MRLSLRGVARMRAGFVSSRPSRHRYRKKVRSPASFRAEDDLRQAPAVQLREKAADREVVGVLGARLPPELAAEVVGELPEVLAVGPDRVGGGVPLALEVTEEGGGRGLHGLAGRRGRLRRGLGRAAAGSGRGSRGRGGPWQGASSTCPGRAAGARAGGRTRCSWAGSARGRCGRCSGRGRRARSSPGRRGAPRPARGTTAPTARRGGRRPPTRRSPRRPTSARRRRAPSSAASRRWARG